VFIVIIYHYVSQFYFSTKDKNRNTIIKNAH